VTHALIDFLRKAHSSFFVARMLLKLGREVPVQFASEEEDRAMAADIRRVCLQLGIKDLPESL
jgi:hypothetical protein